MSHIVNNCWHVCWNRNFAFSAVSARWVLVFFCLNFKRELKLRIGAFETPSDSNGSKVAMKWKWNSQTDGFTEQQNLLDIWELLCLKSLAQ